MKGRFTIGFTMIELMIAIAIIVILVSIALPVFSRVKGSAIKTNCISNLHQLSAAMILYAADHDDKLPPHPNFEAYLAFFEPGQGGWGIPTKSESPKRLIQSMHPYTKNKTIWFCPADPVKRQPVFKRGIVHEYTSYTYWPITKRWHKGRAWPLVSSISDIGDNLGSFALLWDADDFASIPQIPQEDRSDHPGEMTNYAMADGSVRSKKPPRF